MNEPIEHAQKTTGKVTARQLLAVYRAGPRHCYLHGKAAPNRASYSDSFIFTFSSCETDRKTKSETVTKIDLPGWVSNGTTSTREIRKDSGGKPYGHYTEAYRPLGGFWSLSYNDALPAVLELLPRDAEVSFFVYLDAGTNGYLVEAESTECAGLVAHKGLHNDRIYLVAEWGPPGKRRERHFLIDTSTCPHNTARFGGPQHEADTRGR